ncbi:hypothetical protein ILUMI_27072 [Ignelater luminosus]|uniref:Uncharacterized protein n=1 Tax=Ignelater luminosus TaxID=2038154 RepID=A0A8K0C3C1_IGNLU|nr:hypothetical protein ILUMI_27072 [Ignelater luminosus]
MPKPQYTQHFRDSWLQDPHLKDWLQVIKSTTGQVAKCKFCDTTLRSHYGDLKSHGKSKKHLQKKFYWLIIHYKLHQKIVSTYLDLAELHECNAEGIVSAIKKTLKRFDLRLENLMGIGTDNASVMVGVNNGVFTKLKEEVPHLILVRCLCHSLQLAISAAAKEFLPRNLEVIQNHQRWTESRFEELATFAITLLILSHSNADVERLFSSMNVIKNKQRNRMKLNLLTAILRVRCGLGLEGKCCNEYEIPINVVNQIGTKESYQSETDDDGADKNDSSEEIMSVGPFFVSGFLVVLKVESGGELV